MSVGHPAPMKRDAIFRIGSLAKPMTAVAAMIAITVRGLLKSSAPQADSAGTAASVRRPTRILPKG
jgi:CubicO group peptidase (beta-lactamase class C family)